MQMRYKRLFIQDVGGLPADGGLAVRRGLLYRSGDLYRLREEDLSKIDNLKLGQVFDLRQAEAARSRPNSYTAPLVRHFPVRMGVFEDLTLSAALQRRVEWSRYDFTEFYVIILEQNKDFLRRDLELLVEGPHPALVHCTAGKDRTGVFVTVLLLALRVSRDRVLEWYKSIEGHLKRNTPRRVRLLAWYTGTPRETLSINLPAVEKLFNHLGDRYGGIDGYLEEIGFSGANQLRSLFLA